MSYCKKTGPEGKDKIIFATEEDHKKPSTIQLPPADPAPGLILPNGDINWNCPCLGGMATGPCGVEFRTAFSCFHYSEKEPKGSECLETFQAMQDCMKKYPKLYKPTNSDEDEDEFSSFSAQGSDAAEQITDDGNPAVVPSPTSDKVVEKASS